MERAGVASGTHFIGHTDPVEVRRSPDGQYVVTASADDTARIWNTTSGQELLKFTGRCEAVKSAIFAPDGKTVLSGSDDTSARLWDAATGREVRRFAGHTDK